MLSAIDTFFYQFLGLSLGFSYHVHVPLASETLSREIFQSSEERDERQNASSLFDNTVS